MTKEQLFTALGEIDPKYAKDLDLLYRKTPSWRGIMKKSVSITAKLVGAAVTAVIVLGLIFLPGLWQDSTPTQAASPTEEDPLRICVDLHGRMEPDPLRALVQKFQRQLKENAGLEHLKFEFVPESGEKRDAAVRRLRNEIMAGGGPDVFILDTNAVDYGETNLFPYPQSAMRDGRFLELNEYIDHASYMKREELTESVLRCGQMDGQQLLLPMSYSFSSSVFLREDVPVPEEALSWEQCAKSDDPVLVYSAGSTIYSFGALPMIFGTCVDPENGELTFTLEELQETTASALEASWADRTGLPQGVRSMLGVWRDYGGAAATTVPGEEDNLVIKHITSYYESGLLGSSPARAHGEHDEVLTHLPFPNRDGGVTALISAFTAVNANTKYPDDAFTVLDYLFSKKCQAEGELVEDSLTLYVNVGGFPLLDEAGFSSCHLYQRWINDESFEDLRRVRDRINAACFWTPIEYQLTMLYIECDSIRKECLENGTDWKQGIRPKVEETYEELLLLAAES